MKNIINYRVVFVLLIFFNISCQEDMPEILDLPILQTNSLDDNAGSWKTVTNMDYDVSFLLNTPVSVEDENYQSGLLELQEITQNRTPEQERKVAFWSASGVLRWNRILRNLVAKYNRPPAENTNNPFAHPPFAARAYALLSVAQHEALIETWKLKYTTNRVAPGKSNPNINVQFKISELPSYPSEQAVIAGVSVEILKSLFPAETNYLNQLAEEQKNTVLWGGAGTRGDINDGNTLGKFVASKILEFVDNDRMKQSNDPENKYISFFNINSETVPEPWISISSPQTKPLAPLYGSVRTWADSTLVFSYLPPPPPGIGSDDFKKDISNVRKISDNRSREQWRITEFWADGSGTYTPSGHWNLIAENLIIEANWSEIRTARALSIMNRAIMDSGILCWYAKYKYYYPRPSQIDPKIKISTGIPNFPAYTSGHSSFSAAAGTTLGYLFPNHKDELIRQYIEAGESRVYGGIHFQFDNLEGRKSGVSIGLITISSSMNDGADF
jgi:hypothetical protein